MLQCCLVWLDSSRHKLSACIYSLECELQQCLKHDIWKPKTDLDYEIWPGTLR